MQVKDSKAVKKIIKQANTYKELGKLLKIKSKSVLLQKLLDVLTDTLSKKKFQSETIHGVVYKMISFIEEIIIDDKDTAGVDFLNKLTDLKCFLINRIKEVDKGDRINNDYVSFLRDVVNKLEKIELALLYDNVSETTLINYNIVSQIVFNEKSIRHTIYLIDKYPYIINIYNMTEEPIVDRVVKDYMKALDFFVSNHTNKADLFYFNNTLIQIMNSEKIKTDSDTVKRCLDYINKNKKNSHNKTYNLWLLHLEDVLLKRESSLTLDDVNFMYNIHDQSVSNGPFIIDSTLTDTFDKDDFIITADNKFTTDRDDALAIKMLPNGNYLLKIIITDPNYYFDVNSMEMRLARIQGESIYYGLDVIHMFPEDVVKGYLSLDKNKLRPARIYVYELDKYGEVVNFKIEKGAVKVDENLSYEKLNYIIEHNSDSKQLDQSIGLLLDLEGELSKKYGENISDEFDSDELVTNGESLVAKYMVFNNHRVPLYFSKMGYPFIYTSHILHKKLESILKSNIRLDGSNKELEALIISLEKICMGSYYNIKPEKHEGLGFECYGFTTSPLRKFVVNINNDCEDYFYFRKISDRDAEQFIKYLNSSVKYLNERHNEIMEYYKARSRVRERDDVDG